ncbi:MAG: hypothetical protein JOY72_03345 [Actinobacteria bacterium]|nr:hypothetical protein [Actinomycetota bacterium]MBV8479315.1 hypothetical protein [Actinomycetota bacterium]
MSEGAGGWAELVVVDDGYVAFLAAGEQAEGDFRCSGCGYGVSIHRALPVCPMCGGVTWEQPPPRLN